MKSNTSPIFNISHTKLVGIIEKIANEPINSFNVNAINKKLGPSGIRGDYLVPTIEYTTKSLSNKKITIFVRRPHRERPGESQLHHYEYLSGRNIPIPKLYDSIIDGEGREVLFLEYLEEIREEDEIFLSDENHVRKFLSLMAQFNTTRLSIDYIAQLGNDMARRNWVRNWNIWLTWAIFALKIFEERAYSGELGKTLKNAFCTSSDKLNQLKELSIQLMNHVNKFKKGYIHGDFHPGNTAWRHRRKELVVFDFEDVMIDVRFYDIAMYLGAPDNVEKRCIKQNDLAEYYLEQYYYFSGESINIKNFLNELYIIWLAHKCNIWSPMFDTSSIWSEMPKEEKQRRSDQIYEQLDMLFCQIPLAHRSGLL